MGVVGDGRCCIPVHMCLRAPVAAVAELPPLGWRVWWRYWVVDHAWVRLIVPNLYQIDADVWRSNQPGRRRLRRLKARGVRAVLSLRGDSNDASSVIEKRAAAEAGIPLHFVRMRAYKLPQPEVLLDAVGKLRTLPKPLLIHCKSGADRTGLMVTIYLHVMKGVPLAEARRALGWQYAHASWGKAGIVHEVLDAYARDAAETGIAFETWVATRYDPEALTKAFEARPWYRRGPQRR
jgi:protein tyrosine/serine phosphatase